MARATWTTWAASGLTLAALAGPTAAADLGGERTGRGGHYPPPPDNYLEIERWTGFYLGGTLGYGWGDGRTSGDIGSFPFEQSGTIGTIYAGYNWQLGRTVLGLEADIGTGDFGTSETTPSGALKSSLNALGSFRGRAGFLVSPALLIYGTAGLAWADMDFQMVGDKARSETFFGYQVGIGAELMVSNNVTLRLEALHTGFDSERVVHSGMTNGFEPDFDTVRAGISFKF